MAITPYQLAVKAKQAARGPEYKHVYLFEKLSDEAFENFGVQSETYPDDYEQALYDLHDDLRKLEDD